MSGAIVRTGVLAREAETDAWERAYLRFETPRRNDASSPRRLRAAGVLRWPRDSVVLDLFSGRGGVAAALRGLGFSHVMSVDVSPRLGSSQRRRGGLARSLTAGSFRVASASVDVAIVRAACTISRGSRRTCRRSLPRSRGYSVQAVSSSPSSPGARRSSTSFIGSVLRRLARRLSPKLDALATMIELERTTYEGWLASPREILGVFDRPLRAAAASHSARKASLRGNTAIEDSRERDSLLPFRAKHCERCVGARLDARRRTGCTARQRRRACRRRPLSLLSGMPAAQRPHLVHSPVSTGKRAQSKQRAASSPARSRGSRRGGCEGIAGRRLEERQRATPRGSRAVRSALAVCLDPGRGERRASRASEVSEA